MFIPSAINTIITKIYLTVTHSSTTCQNSSTSKAYHHRHHHQDISKPIKSYNKPSKQPVNNEENTLKLPTAKIHHYHQKINWKSTNILYIWGSVGHCGKDSHSAGVPKRVFNAIARARAQATTSITIIFNSSTPRFYHHYHHHQGYQNQFQIPKNHI